MFVTYFLKASKLSFDHISLPTSASFTRLGTQFLITRHEWNKVADSLSLASSVYCDLVKRVFSCRSGWNALFCKVDFILIVFNKRLNCSIILTRILNALLVRINGINNWTQNRRCGENEWTWSTTKKVSIFVRGSTKPRHFCLNFFLSVLGNVQASFTVPLARSRFIWHFAQITFECIFMKLAFSMNFISLYVGETLFVCNDVWYLLSVL